MPLRIKLLLVMASVTTLVLTGSVLSVLSRQEITLERIALVSGTSISDFVTHNAGVLFAENAGLPPDQQDWTTLQAYVASASKDPQIRSMAIADGEGVIRAASDPGLIGHRYRAAHEDRPVSEAVLARPASRIISITEVPDLGAGAGLRFVRPVRYAGADFGSVEIVMKREALDAAIADTRDMLLGLAMVVIIVVAGIGYLSGAMVTHPLARLTKALREAAECGFSLRLSHHRRDEFATAFDAFNAAAAAIEPRLDAVPVAELEANVALTRVVAVQRSARV